MNDDADKGQGHLPWYRAPIVWIGAVISLLIIFGYTHLIILSHQHSTETPAATTKQAEHKKIDHLLGMPLSRDAIGSNTHTTTNKQP